MPRYHINRTGPINTSCTICYSTCGLCHDGALTTTRVASRHGTAHGVLAPFKRTPCVGWGRCRSENAHQLAPINHRGLGTVFTWTLGAHCVDTWRGACECRLPPHGFHYGAASTLQEEFRDVLRSRVRSRIEYSSIIAPHAATNFINVGVITPFFN